MLFHAEDTKPAAGPFPRARNVQRFGGANYDVPPTAVNEQALEEIALLVLGQSNQFIQRFKRIA